LTGTTAEKDYYTLEEHEDKFKEQKLFIFNPKDKAICTIVWL
jgi:hypothetical protein